MALRITKSCYEHFTDIYEYFTNTYVYFTISEWYESGKVETDPFSCSQDVQEDRSLYKHGSKREKG